MGICHQNLWACRSPDLTESLAHHGFMLGRVLLVLQAPRLDGPFFDLRSPFDVLYLPSPRMRAIFSGWLEGHDLMGLPEAQLAA